MHYITIPVWVFVIIVILASLMALLLLIFFIGIFAALFVPTYKYEHESNEDTYDPDSYELGMELKKEDETDKSES